jgi:type I restriction enzyme S subunit
MSVDSQTTNSSPIENLITDNMDVWTSAIKRKSSAGRGSSKKIELYGIKKLRELILELAVRGKLVAQDASDEPASILLERIAQEKAQLVKEGKIKKPKKLPEISEDEKLFELPEGWGFIRLGDVYELEYGDNLPKDKRDESGLINVYGSNGVVGTHSSSSVNSPCIVIGRKGSAGALNLCDDEECWVTDVAYSVSPPSVINIRFSFMQFHTFGLDQLGKGIKPGLNRNEAYPLVIALPPTEEQHRIVAKVDELMALCDQLEAQTESSLDAHQTLVTVLLNTLVNSQNSEELTEKWTRLSGHFDTLFTTEHSIDQLRQTILQLAVMGKLVQEDPNDDPIEKLLDEIYAEQFSRELSNKEKTVVKNGYENAKKSITKNVAFATARFICGFITKGTTPSKHQLLEIGDVPFLKVYNIVKNKINFSYKPIFISAETNNGKLKRSRVFPNDVIMNIVGPPLGKVAVISDEYPEWNINQALAVFRPLAGIYSQYIYYMLSTDTVLASVLKEVKGTAGQDNLSLEQCRDLLIPIPSIKQQRRIVMLIEEMMGICDQLKARLSDAQTTQLNLADALVEQTL